MHVLYPVLLDHRSPALGEAKAVSRPAAMGDMWREDGDNFALTAVTSNSLWLYFVTGHNILSGFRLAVSGRAENFTGHSPGWD